MSYKEKASGNRAKLFGGSSSSSGPKHKRDAAANRDALFGDGGGSKKPSSSSSVSTKASGATSKTSSRAGYTGGGTSAWTSKTAAGSSKKQRPKISMSSEALQAKMEEAEEYKAKANKCMQRSMFSRPDPVAASTYFKRAADCYKQAGEFRLERLYRLSSADCNFQVGAWASAAADYTRVAELLLEALQYSDEDPNDKMDPQQRRRDASMYHKKASEAWTQMGEKAKAANSLIQAAIALNSAEDDDDVEAGTYTLAKEALVGMEEAVEAHVPDVLNPYARYRQTGHSAYIDPQSDETVEKPSAQTKELAESNIVTRAYAHEPLFQLAYSLVRCREFPSALYSAGAATTILERDGMSTLTLSRAYVTETVLTLAMGDPILAEQMFLNRHVQKSTYLTSRECKLAEDLFRAVKMRDQEALEEARDPAGSNRAALANLDPSLQKLVPEIRLSGVARKLKSTDANQPPPQQLQQQASKPQTKQPELQVNPTTSDPTKQQESLQDLLNQKTGYEKEVEEGTNLDPNALQAELDDLNFGGDDDDLEDDDIDLR